MRGLRIIGAGVFIALLLTACSAASRPTSTPSAQVASARADIPAYPGAVPGGAQGAVGAQVYLVRGADMRDVVAFYKQRLPSEGWELLGEGDTTVQGVGPATTLWFAKGDTILAVEVFLKDGQVVIAISFA